MDLYLFEDLLKAGDEAELKRSAQRVVEKLGFESFNYGLAYRRNGEKEVRYFVFDTLPQAWMDRYFEQGYIDRDPDIPHCYNNTTPIVWTTRYYKQHGVLDMHNEACSLGINGGGCLPIHAPWLKGAGMLALTTPEDADAVEPHVMQRLHAASTLACYLSQAVRNIALPADMAFRQTEELSPRELECLRWASAGLPAKLISDRMGISTATVTAHHLPNIRRKLGVSSTREAVSLAVYHGLIQP